MGLMMKPGTWVKVIGKHPICNAGCCRRNFIGKYFKVEKPDEDDNQRKWGINRLWNIDGSSKTGYCLFPNKCLKKVPESEVVMEKL